jgi:serine/threonine protein kinase
VNSILDETYLILDFIDSGAHGKVFKCKSLKNDRMLVAKFTANTKMFFEEITAMSHLLKSKCRSIPKLVDFSTLLIQDYESPGSETWGYYIIPFYEASDYLLSPEGVLRMGVQLLSSLEAVHLTGRTYNDLKHDNVIIQRNGRVTLIDFGLCQKYVDKEGGHIPEEAQVDSFRGNIAFASPHVLNFGKPSRRDDLFSLAYMLLYMLNGNSFPGYF